MKLTDYIKNLKLGARMMTECNPRIVWKFIRNFGLRNLVGIRRFEQRQQEGAPFYPAFVMISITSSCNLSCSGCWVTTKSKKELSLEQLDGIIAQSKQNGSYFFGLLGGEPLLHKGLFQLLKKHSDCYFQLFTNGMLITPEIARQLKEVGNVTPLISIEGLEQESDKRRGGQQVFGSSIRGIELCAKEGLIIGAAASICNSNIDELATQEYLEFLAKKGIHYLWYYIYRPVGVNPCPDKALSASQIYQLRSFIVESRKNAPLAVIDAYWDDKGAALCPAAVGLSHHISPSGAVEFCPPIQMAKDFLNQKGDNLQEIFNHSEFLSAFRTMAAEHSRGCIILENPQRLATFLAMHGAIDTSGRGTVMNEYLAMQVQAGHDMKEKAIPEKNPFFRLAKKYYFFGFGAYG